MSLFKWSLVSFTLLAHNLIFGQCCFADIVSELRLCSWRNGVCLGIDWNLGNFQFKLSGL